MTSKKGEMNRNDWKRLLQNLAVFVGLPMAINLQTIVESGEIDLKRFLISSCVAIVLKITMYLAEDRSLPPENIENGNS